MDYIRILWKGKAIQMNVSEIRETKYLSPELNPVWFNRFTLPKTLNFSNSWANQLTSNKILLLWIYNPLHIITFISKHSYLYSCHRIATPNPTKILQNSEPRSWNQQRMSLQEMVKSLLNSFLLFLRLLQISSRNEWMYEQRDKL